MTRLGFGSVGERADTLISPLTSFCLELKAFLMETPKRISDNQFSSTDGQVRGLIFPMGHQSGWMRYCHPSVLPEILALSDSVSISRLHTHLMAREQLLMSSLQLTKSPQRRVIRSCGGWTLGSGFLPG